MSETHRPLSSPPPAAVLHREHQLTRVLAMSFDSAASPSITLKAVHQKNDDREAPFGWGFAWYPGQTECALVVKDPTSIGDNAMTKLLSDWERFHSTVFVCHLRGAARTIREEDTHPFSRSYAGRDWVFAHNGDLEGDLKEVLPLHDPLLFKPIGNTDSERVLSWLLQEFHARGKERIADFGFPELFALFKQLDALGTANFVFTDGIDLCVYRDEQEYNDLSWARLVPPHEHARLVGEDIEVDLSDASARNRTALVFATSALEGLNFTRLEPGQMLVARRGAFVWDSAKYSGSIASMAPPSIAVPKSPVIYGMKRDPAKAGSIREERTTSIARSQSPLTNLRPMVLPGRVLSVTHETLYRYTSDVERSSHVFRLKPVHDPHQEILSHAIDVSVDGVRRDYEDVFGNMTTRLELETPYRELRIVSRSLVRVNGELSPSLHSLQRRFSFPLVWMPWQRQMMLPYLLPPELPESELDELYEFAMSFVERQDHDLVETLLDMNLTIYRDFRYESGSTNLGTTPYDVYRDRRGVCQDFANLMICLARLLNIPARYRVGYIFTGGEYENKVQSEASHAWAELYLPWIGWQGFDPTNGCLVQRDHVRVACGRNYRDATPTSGTLYKGGENETLTVTVRVEESDNLP